MQSYRKASAQKAADYVMATAVSVDPGMKRQSAEAAGKYFVPDFSMGAPAQAVAQPAQDGGPKTDAGRALMKLLEEE